MGTEADAATTTTTMPMPIRAAKTVKASDFNIISTGPAKKTRDGFIVGQQDVSEGPIGTFQIFLNCELGPNSNRKLQAFPIHEIPLVRRMYAVHGNEFKIFLNGWTPGIDQARGMTRQEVENEYRRLAGNPFGQPKVPGLYRIGGEQPQDERDMFVEIYGAGQEGHERFFAVMIGIFVAWKNLCALIAESGRAVTQDDIDAILEVIDPTQHMIDGRIEAVVPELPPLELSLAEDATAAGPLTAGSAAVDVEPADSELIDFLIKREIPDAIAKAFAAVIATHSAPVDKDWDQVPLGTKGKDQQKKKLLALLTEFKAPKKPAAELA